MRASRASYRDRHGRGLRRPILAGKVTTGHAKATRFTEAVSVVCFFLKEQFPDEFGKLTWVAQDTPEVTGDEVRRWDADRDKCEITIYRVPIERLGHSRRMDPNHERMHAEQAVFEAAGYLTDSDPWRFYERWQQGPEE
jgi:hypothetical protein